MKSHIFWPSFRGPLHDIRGPAWRVNYYLASWSQWIQLLIQIQLAAQSFSARTSPSSLPGVARGKPLIISFSVLGSIIAATGFTHFFPMLGSRSRKTNIFTFFKPFLPPARSSPSPHALGKWKRRAWRAAANGKLIIESAGFEIRLRVINLLIMMLNTDSCSPIEAGAAGCCHRIICHILRSANQKNLAWFSLGFQFQL